MIRKTYKIPELWPLAAWTAVAVAEQDAFRRLDVDVRERIKNELAVEYPVDDLQPGVGTLVLRHLEKKRIN